MPFVGQETEPLWVKVFKVSETPEMVQAERGREGGWDALEVLPPLPVALALLLVSGVPALLPAPALPFISPARTSFPARTPLHTGHHHSRPHGLPTQTAPTPAMACFLPDDLTSAPSVVPALMPNFCLSPLGGCGLGGDFRPPPLSFRQPWLYYLPLITYLPGFITALAAVPLVTPAPAIQGNSLLRGGASHQGAWSSVETQGHLNGPCLTTTLKHLGFGDGEKGWGGAPARSRAREQAGDAYFCCEEEKHCWWMGWDGALTWGGT